jgi:CBS domain-containing protein
MTVRHIHLTPTVITLSPEMSLKQALGFMLDRGINHLPVLDERGYCGLLDLNDILLELIPASARVNGGLNDLRFAGDADGLLKAHLEKLAHRSVGELVRRDQPVLREDCPLLAAALQLSRQTAPMPVLDGNGRLLGLLSRRALLRHLVEAEEGKA